MDDLQLGHWCGLEPFKELRSGIDRSRMVVVYECKKELVISTGAQRSGEICGKAVVMRAFNLPDETWLCDWENYDLS